MRQWYREDLLDTAAMGRNREASHAQRAIALIDAAAAADTANQKVKEEAAGIHWRADALHAH